ncbi:S-layer homology domain-containing protein [Paenibacillus crassostreae]|uniref:SLH domain-containing protein n=1 Tax=Paenibacillus crassostreae TaxID=1763538 RepID=A0A167AQS7_9BACL|nr:S-layer homology domain-containing protein [Paenibacillus crassostreae]AOZ93791.1 hypothetical protein LPB68_17410 [Paenibacillus crassostreae]OAB71326.1 hypothetical protein PNBC_20280 [Paenibacillus crassostreae]
MNKQKINVTKTAILCSVLVASLSFGSSALAFSDLSGDPAEVKINALKSSNVISGISDDLFAPKSKVTYAQGLQFLVNAFDLTMDNTSAKASEYFDNVVDGTWYTKAFLIAHHNGLSVDKTVNPNEPITRAQFAHLVTQSLFTKGNFPVTKMYFTITDAEKLPQDVSNSLQTLLNTRILTLPENGKFRPNDDITRSEAAILIYDALEFAKKIIPQLEMDIPQASYETSISTEKIAEDVNKVSLTVAGLPNPGYSASIKRIEFGPGLTATVYFTVNSPDPDQINIQVISKSTVVTYLPSNYKAVAKYEASSVESDDPFSLMLPVENPGDLIAK